MYSIQSKLRSIWPAGHHLGYLKSRNFRACRKIFFGCIKFPKFLVLITLNWGLLGINFPTLNLWLFQDYFKIFLILRTKRVRIISVLNFKHFREITQRFLPLRYLRSLATTEQGSKVREWLDCSFDNCLVVWDKFHWIPCIETLHTAFHGSWKEIKSKSINDCTKRMCHPLLK